MGFKAKDLCILLDFMYNVVANVYYDNLEDFFFVQAEEHKLIWLTEGSGINNEQV